MKNGFRLLLILAFITFITSSCNRSVIQSQSGAAYKDDTTPIATVASAPVRDLDKIELDPAAIQILNDSKKPTVQLADLAYNHQIASIDSLVEHSFRHNGFNGTVLVGEKGKILYEKAVGYADFSTGQPVDINSIFQLASVSKQFTAMCIMILKQAGKLSYDDELTQYFPELPYKGITIRELLNHTSGLPNYMWMVPDRWKSDYPPYNNDIIAMLAKYHPPVYFKPGTRFLYSNTGYMLLASIVEKVSGMEFRDFANKYIFAPLGMTNTFVYCTSHTCNVKDHLSGYKPYRRGRLYKVGPDVLDGSVGDKGVHSTVEDLYKWDQALYTDKLVKQDILAEAFTRGRLKNNREIDYGFGFRLVDKDGKHIIYHNGLWNGFRSAIIRDVDDDMTIIVLNNTNSHGKQVVEMGIQQILNKGLGSDLGGSENEDDAKGGE